MSDKINQRILKRYFDVDKDASDSMQDFPNNPELQKWTKAIMYVLNSEFNWIIKPVHTPSDVHSAFVSDMRDSNSKAYKKFVSKLQEALEAAAVICANERGY